MRRARGAAAGLVAAVLLLAVCFGLRARGPARGEPAGFSNLLLVTLDTTRADRLGCYGREGAETPGLDRLAAEGILFERCFSATPLTLPAHATILTGMLPGRHGVRVNGLQALPEAVETLAERLGRAGFQTGAVVSAQVLDARYGLDSGFERYDDDLSGGRDPGLLLYPETSAADTLRRAQSWLDARGPGRFFLWVHFFDPHHPYEPPEPYQGRHASDPYQGEIAYADACLGRLLDRLAGDGVLDRTLVAVIGDHGEALGEHGESTHGLFVYDATTRVPLVLRHPALPAGRRVEAVVSAADLAPTVLELLAVPGTPLDGRSLAPAWERAGSLPASPAYSELMHSVARPGWADLRTLRTLRWRFVAAPRPELYDLLADPGETTDLSAAEPAVAAGFQERLAALRPAAEARAPEVEADARAAAGLAQLGYLPAAPAPAGAETEAGADPKDLVRQVERTQAALAAIRAARYGEAGRLMRGVLEDDPADATAASLLLGCWLASGRLAEARDWLASRVGDGAGPVEPILLAFLDQGAGRGGAVGPLEDQLASGRGAFISWVATGRLAEEGADWEQAAAAYRAAARREPGSAAAWLGLARAERSRGRAPEARAAARRALAADPYAAGPVLLLAGLDWDAGRTEEAARGFREAARLDPRDPRPALGTARAALNRGDEEAGRRAAVAALATREPAVPPPETFLLLAPGLSRDALAAFLEQRQERASRARAFREAAEAFHAARDPARAAALEARARTLAAGRLGF